ncbi:wd40 repeat-containing protein [Nannochloropsis oceanica]
MPTTATPFSPPSPSVSPDSSPRQKLRPGFGKFEITKHLYAYRQGRLSKNELCGLLHKHRHELLMDDPHEGNVVHGLIRKGHTKALLQVVLPHHPEAVLALERSRPRDDTTDEKVTLLRRAVERKDRMVVEGIVKAIKRVLDQGLKQDDASSASSPPPSPFLSSSSTPSQRQEAMEVLLRLEDWRLALLEYPSLLETSAVRSFFNLQPSCAGVVDLEAEESDYRANLGPGESKTLGFWAAHINNKTRKPSLFSKEGLRLLTSPRRWEGEGEGGIEGGVLRGSSGMLPSPGGGEGGDGRYRRLASSKYLLHADISHVYHEITETSGVEVEAALVAFPAALRSGQDSFLRLCCDLYERTGKTWIFELEAPSLILKYKWTAFGRPIYTGLLALSLLLALNYSLASALLLPLLHSNAPWRRTAGLVWQGLLLANAFPLVCQEYWQWHAQGFRAYFFSWFRLLDLLTLLLTFASILLRFFLVKGEGEKENIRTLYHMLSAIASWLLWAKLLVYLRGFKETGPLIRMIWQIVKDTRFFLVVLAVSVMGFSNCLYLLFQEDIQREDAMGTTSPIRSSYGSLFHTVLVLFAALNSNLDYLPFNASHFKVLVSLIYLFYCVCSTIILLNLLIALMGDSYDKVQENALAQGRYEQAVSVLEIEDMLPQRILQDPRFFPRWVQVLRPKPGADGGMVCDAGADRWGGRLRQIYKKIEHSEKRLSQDIEGLFNAVGRERKEGGGVMEGGVGTRLARLEDNVEGLQGKLDQILAMLHSAVQDDETSDEEDETSR